MDEQKRYRILNRSSDLLIRVFGQTQAELFANSGFALFDLMTDVEKVQIGDRLPLEVEGVDRDDLMVNWMRELLYLYQGSGYLLKEFKVREAKDNYVRAEVSGEKFDPDRHEIQREIRSVAYHQSRMEKTGEQWTAQVLFEI
ncbi:MAG: archease [Deltaproteobacteria bacterium]|nr:MAG: archease [Deltaproteobacteria bacterium]